MDPLASAVLLNASRRYQGEYRRGQERQRYKEARAVKGRATGTKGVAPWNQLNTPMKLYLCDSVKEQLQKAIQAEADQAYKERYGNTL